MLRLPGTRGQLRLINLTFVALFFVTVGLLQWISQTYNLQFDWTRNARHSLSPASIAVAERLNGPVTITAYASENGDLRQIIQKTIARYQRHKLDIDLVFVDPDTVPQTVREAGIQYDGELVFQYGESREHVAPHRLDEEQITNALIRLGQRRENWIVFLRGHGERSFDRPANFDISNWAAELRKRGFKTRAFSLGEHPQLPQNTAVLVIAGPRVRLLVGETEHIANFVRGGGNLLWLTDPGPLHGLEPLAELLGVEFIPGVVVDRASAALTQSASAVVIAAYGSHPIVKNFANGEVTLFPHASALTYAAPEGWRASALIDTSASAWSEAGALEGRIKFDKGTDIAGPHTLGVALTREIEQSSDSDAKNQQRVVVLGDGDFLSNSFLANGANLDLGMSVVNWLSQNDAYVSIPVRTAPDRSLKLSHTAQATMAVTFLLVIPLLLASGGVTVWLRRRRR